MSQKQKTQTDDFYISVDEMAQLSGTSKPTIYRWLQQGAIPAFHLGPNGRTKRVPRDTFMAILAHAEKKGGDLRGALKEPTAWSGKIPAPTSRRVTGASVLDTLPETPSAAPLPAREVHRLAQLEKRYRIGTLSLVEKLAEGKPLPRALPKKTAQQWAAALGRVDVR